MSTGKPWDDPDSDPTGDIEEYARAGRERWLPDDAPPAITGSARLTPEQWTELEEVGRVDVGDGTMLRMGSGRLFFAPAHTPPPQGPLPPAPYGTTVELRIYGKPYRWIRPNGRLRLQRIESPPMYDELVRAHLDLASGNPAFRDVGSGG